MREIFKKYRRLLGYQKKKGWISALCILTSGISIFLLFSTTGVLLQKLIQANTGRALADTLKECFWFLLLVLFFGFLSGFAPIGVVYVQEDVRKRIRLEMLWRYVHAREDKVSLWNSSDVLMRLNEDLSKTVDMIGNYMNLYFLNPIISGLLSLTVVSGLDWRIGLYCFVTPFFSLLVLRPVLKKTVKLKEEAQKLRSHMTAGFSDSLYGAKELKLFQQEEKQVEKIKKYSVNIREGNIRLGRIYGLRRANLVIGDLLGTGGLLFLGALLTRAGSITFDRIMIAIPLADQISQLVFGLFQLSAAFAQAAPSINRVFEVLDLEPEEEGSQKTVETPQNGEYAAVVFDKVNFSYEEGFPVLKDVSFTLKEGETIAFVGESGSGKSSILQLLLGFYPDYQGTIKVFGRERSETELSVWRSQFSYVQQSSPLFQVSVAENIAFGRESASMQEIREAAEEAYAGAFIEELPGAYDYEAGELGNRLSGGQRQRIAIARSFLRSAPILLLDEVTAALDNESERLIKEALEKRKGTVSSIIVTHKLDLTEHADRIYVLDHGSIAEQGTHQELLQSEGGCYSRMWNMQHSGSGS